jgi:hypothetical protein
MVEKPMKTRHMLIALSGCLATVTLAMALMVLSVALDNRALRREAAALRATLERATAETTALNEERLAARVELTAQQDRLRRLEDRLSRLTDDRDDSGVRAQRARAYVGNRHVGMGWVLPSRLSTNTAGEEAVRDAVVVLDEPARGTLPAGWTNAVQRELVPATTVNYNYPYPYWSTWWPYTWVYCVEPPTNRPNSSLPPLDAQPRLPQPPKPTPQVPSPFLSTRIFQPQTGWVRTPPGRPGGDWISTSPRGISYLSGGRAIQAPTLPQRY